jgi:hypothetical protein
MGTCNGHTLRLVFWLQKRHTPLIYVGDMNGMRLAFVCALALRIDLVQEFVLVMLQSTLAVEGGLWWL